MGRRAANFPLHSSISLSVAASSILLQRPKSPAIARSFSSSLGAMAPPHTKVAIIGSGPAAHTAAIYLSRAELKPVMYEGMLAGGTAAGGQLTTTTDVENYPGFSKGIGGSELMDEMKAQSERFGTEIITETITKVDLKQKPFRLWREYEDGETYWQNGISACAVCDGAVPIFR